VSDAGLQTIARRTIGFGPLTLPGRPLLGEAPAIRRLSNRLQALADADAAGLQRTGWHYLVRAVKRSRWWASSSRPVVARWPRR